MGEGTRLRGLQRELLWHPGTEYYALGVIVVAAALLRFFRLGEWSFWGDEIFSLGGRSDGFVESTTVQLIHLTISKLGTSEWSARLVPALIGTLSVPVLYFPAKRMLGARVGLLAALLLAISPWHLYWSQNARFYVLLLLFHTLALLTFFLGLEEDKPVFILGSLIFFGLAAKERLLAFFFLPIAVLYIICLILFRYEKPAGLHLKNLAIFFVPLGIVGLVFAFPYLGNIRGWFESFSRVNNNPFWLAGGTFYYTGLPVILLAAAGGVHFLVKRSRPALYLVLGAAVPFIGVVGLSFFHYTANRYIFVALTSWLLLASMASTELFAALHGNSRILAGGVIAVLVASALSENMLYFQYQHGNRDRWREALQIVREEKGPGDLVVVANTGVGDYYLGEEVVGIRQLARLDLDQYRRVWLVEDMTVKQLYPEEHAWIENNTQLVANLDNHFSARVFTMRVYVYAAENQTDADAEYDG